MTELERNLVALGRELEVPATPDLVPAVLRRLEPRRRALPARRLVLALALALVALIAAALAVPGARSALFRALHIGGEEIVRVDQLPSVVPQRPLASTLGRAVSLRQAQRRVGFRLRVPDERPDHVYVNANGTVWLLYGTPRHVRLLVAETPFEHVSHQLFEKLVATGTTVEELTVDGARGAFLSGGQHEVLLVDAHANPVFDSARLARNVLVWSRDGVAYRLEGDFSRDEALRIARALPR